MGMSPFYFARCFRASTGLSPYQYVIDQRVQLARLLIEMGWSATSIAGYLCFSSPSISVSSLSNALVSRRTSGSKNT